MSESDHLDPDRPITLPLGLAEALARVLDEAATSYRRRQWPATAARVEVLLARLRLAIAADTLPEPCPNEVARMHDEGCPHTDEG